MPPAASHSERPPGAFPADARPVGWGALFAKRKGRCTRFGNGSFLKKYPAGKKREKPFPPFEKGWTDFDEMRILWLDQIVEPPEGAAGNGVFALTDQAFYKQYSRMAATPVYKLVLTLAVPTIISMLVTNVYNMADTYFVSGLGTSASGATGVVFGLMSMIQAFGFMFGHGAGSQISRLLGSRELEKSKGLFGHRVLFFGAVRLHRCRHRHCISDRPDADSGQHELYFALCQSVQFLHPAGGPCHDGQLCAEQYSAL